MILSISLIVILSIAVLSLFERVRPPGLIGLVSLGIALGPGGMNLIDPSLLSISDEVRLLALIVIFMRAGLGLNRRIIKKIGPLALRLSFLPGLFEGFSIMIMAHFFLKLSLIQGGMLGFIIAAVSHAVVGPEMLRLKERDFGKRNEIPSTILAAASMDDVVAIILFTVFLGIEGGQDVSIGMSFLMIPVEIILGISLGALIGFLFSLLLKRFHIRGTKKVLLILSVAFVFHKLEEVLPVATLLGVMAIGFVLRERLPVTADTIAGKMERIWVVAEIFLFVLVGASVNVRAIGDSWLMGLLVILLGLTFRSAGVLAATLGSQMDLRERLFCMISYLPKATVQAAVGGIPLAMGVAYGDVILSVSVLSILTTAPLGAIGIRLAARRFAKNQLRIHSVFSSTLFLVVCKCKSCSRFVRSLRLSFT
ncbi:NhaP-type Na+(K+)/H+ antiporter [Mesotoga prima MesG1.Ag.4.2]|uniref:NhaP-type Na+(K+)/H+ antiporter n=1 Tax=Mesotoga prima MesG1.Ag.4.2 TaxID=660470 RepID=I2F1K4_9BACT|nr:cation:proton antiporter [Mesotoga prima]AFK05807.1 NhaP-type Na+(K+)/H+ antiporter [Mesotoga prima MesG1.Ag.4.2]